MTTEKKKVSGTREWSASSVNCMDGCSNDCLYCYAKQQAIRFGRKTAENWKEEVPRETMLGKRFGKRKGTVMFPTTHDITLENIGYCEDVAHKLVSTGNQVLIVSKPTPEAIQRLCSSLYGLSFPYKDRVLFRFTIGAMDSRILRFWEPHAPSFEERLYALMWCFKNGWQTSVSMEPYLVPNFAHAIREVEALSPYVTDAIWIGKMNRPENRIAMNCGGVISPEVYQAMVELVSSQSNGQILEMYSHLKDYPQVKWKESIKKVVGIEVPTEAGLDV